MISIVIPAREEEKVIGETVARLKRELKLPNEIIVSDGGSHDRTVEVAGQCADKVVVFQGTRHTAGRGRNDGAKSAKGEFIAFIDADVFIPEPEAFFRRALAHFEDPRVVGVCGPQKALPDIETWGDKLSFGFLNVITRLQNNVLHKGEASGKIMVVRRSAFEKITGFREDLVTREDGDFFYRLSRVGRTIFDPKLAVFHGARRAHKIGWLKLWTIWTVETIYFAIFNKSKADDWTPIR
ncbi:MAG: glycosyltransferase [Candidatus Kaiserbacteria bacterium]|nr:glycosyltransferase [Candidatus Kaiserbacteria bacterium]